MEKKVLKDILSDARADISKPLCDLTTIFNDIHIVDKKEGISSTIQLFGDISPTKFKNFFKEYLDQTDNNEVYVKIGFSSDYSNRLERRIYYYLSKLLKNHVTPNIMRFAGSFICKNFKASLPPSKLNSQIISKLEKIDPSINTNTAYILVVEKGVGLDIYSCIERNYVTVQDMIKILFQVFYTIRQLYKVGVNHQDLHLGNIWINILEDPEKFTYFVNDNVYYQFETKFEVKIFDFDKSTISLKDIVLDNKKGECGKYGACPTPDERRSIYQVLANLFPPFNYVDFSSDIENRRTQLRESMKLTGDQKGLISPAWLSKLFRQIVPDETFLDPSCCSHRGIPCKQTSLGCDPNSLIPDGSVLTFEQICDRTSLFDTLRHDIRYEGYNRADLPVYKIQDSKFVRNVYFSLDCSLDVKGMINKLFESAKKEKIVIPPSHMRLAKTIGITDEDEYYPALGSEGSIGDTVAFDDDEDYMVID